MTASDDATAQVWDASTGAAVGKALRHRKPVRTAAFSPDGTRLVTVSDEDAALVWDVLPAPATNAYRLASLAEAVAGVKLDAHGNVHLLDTPATLLHQLREEAAAPADFSHWFLADPFTRSISPLSAVRLEEYIDHRLADEGCDQAEAAFFDAPFLSALVRRRHEQSCPATR